MTSDIFPFMNVFSYKWVLVISPPAVLEFVSRRGRVVVAAPKCYSFFWLGFPLMVEGDSCVSHVRSWTIAMKPTLPCV